MARYCPRLYEISAFHPAFWWRGNDPLLLQLRRSSLLCSASTRRSFSLDCRVWLLERRRRNWVTQDRSPSEGTKGLFLQGRSEEHTSELQSLAYLVCRLLLEKKKKK